MRHLSPPLLSRRSVLKTSGALTLSAMLHRSTAATSHATSGREQTGTAAFLELMGYVDKRMSDLGVPSVGVAVVDGDTRHTCALGITNVVNPELADAQTMFRVGPMSRLFTGSAIGSLLESGALNLDAPVKSYLPTFTVVDNGASDNVSIRDLVTHRTGWQGDLAFDPGDGDDALARYVEAMSSLQSIAPVGQEFSYGNTNGILEGHLIAEMTGLPFEAAMRELTLSPLSMDYSSFFPAEIRHRPAVYGHTLRDGMVTPVDPLQSNRVAAPLSGLYSNLNEILLFAAFHAFASTPPTYLGAAVRETMHRSLGTGGSVGQIRIDSMGVNWMISEFGGKRISLHTGSDNGQSSMMAVVPSERFAVVVLTNADFAQDLAIEVAFHALDLFTGLHTPALHSITRPAIELEELTGVYMVPDGIRVEVSAGQGGLHLETTTIDRNLAENMSGLVTFVSPLTGMIKTPESTLFVDFVLDHKHQVHWLRHMGQLAVRFDA